VFVRQSHAEHDLATLGEKLVAGLADPATTERGAWRL